MAIRKTNKIRGDRFGNSKITRICCVCKTLKKLSEYPNDKTNKYGKAYRCKNCEKIDSRLRHLSRYKLHKAEYLKKRVDQYHTDMLSGKEQARVKARRKIPIKTNICCVCKKVSLKLVRHHPDYSRPLFVKIVCQSCHMLIHSKLRSKKVK